MKADELIDGMLVFWDASQWGDIYSDEAYENSLIYPHTKTVDEIAIRVFRESGINRLAIMDHRKVVRVFALKLIVTELK